MISFKKWSEGEDVVGSELLSLLPTLRRAKALINMQEVISYLNQKDIDYTGWTDLEMIVKYLESLSVGASHA